MARFFAFRGRRDIREVAVVFEALHTRMLQKLDTTRNGVCEISVFNRYGCPVSLHSWFPTKFDGKWNQSPFIYKLSLVKLSYPTTTLFRRWTSSCNVRAAKNFMSDLVCTINCISKLPQKSNYITINSIVIENNVKMSILFIICIILHIIFYSLKCYYKKRGLPLIHTHIWVVNVDL